MGQARTQGGCGLGQRLDPRGLGSWPDPKWLGFGFGMGLRGWVGWGSKGVGYVIEPKGVADWVRCRNQVVWGLGLNPDPRGLGDGLGPYPDPNGLGFGSVMF